MLYGELLRGVKVSFYRELLLVKRYLVLFSPRSCSRFGGCLDFGFEKSLSP